MVGGIYPDFAGTLYMANFGCHHILRRRHGHGHTHDFSVGGRTGTGGIPRQDDFLYNAIFLYRAVSVTDNFKPDRIGAGTEHPFPGYRTGLCFSVIDMPGIVKAVSRRD